jgi:SAM-dependent methyltransferase
LIVTRYRRRSLALEARLAPRGVEQRGAERGLVRQPQPEARALAVVLREQPRRDRSLLSIGAAKEVLAAKQAVRREERDMAWLPPMADLEILDPRFVAVYDDLPLWSAAPGLLLLDEVQLAPDMRALDIGSGTGFPLVELAERIGNEGEAHGVDPWGPGVARTREKIMRRGVRNAFVHEGSAEALPFADAAFDLIVSNLGLNNFEHPLAALAECRRVARIGGQIALSTNLLGTFAELYEELPAALAEVGIADAAARVAEHVATRTTVDRTRAMLVRSRFEPVRVVESSFRMRWSCASALLQHSFVRLAFRPSWEALVPEASRPAAMSALTQRLDAKAVNARGIELRVPIACIVAMAV